MDLHHELAGVSSSPETTTLYKALCKAQKSYRPIKRSGVNKIDGFTYATFRDICDATLPSLLENGFAQPSFFTGYDRVLKQWVMVATLNHESGEWISSVCPLLLGYPEGSVPGIQALEIDCTYSKKILMQGLAGGWMEAEGGEEPPKEEPRPEPVKEEKVEIKKQEVKKKPMPDSEMILTRADAALTAKKDNEADIKKIIEHLKDYAKDGMVSHSDVLLLLAKHKLDATVTEITTVPEDKKKEKARAK